MGVDTTHLYDPYGAGRPSVRITSNNAYTHGLFVLDVNHMPFGCGTWPAFWTVGPNWPSHGEIGMNEPLFVRPCGNC
jgi:beta-glucanase (GH16 family)